MTFSFGPVPFNFGPIAPEINPAIEPGYFEPSVFDIADITQGTTTTVTTTEDHNYVIGQEVRLLVAPQWGMYQISQQTGFVTSIPNPNQVVLTINSTAFTPYRASPANPIPTVPQIVAIGDVNTGLISATGPNMPTTTIPGSFNNISPL